MANVERVEWQTIGSIEEHLKEWHPGFWERHREGSRKLDYAQIVDRHELWHENQYPLPTDHIHYIW